jgi:hypothetical protein
MVNVFELETECTDKQKSEAEITILGNLLATLLSQ